jgi:hypothetical protein
MRDRVNEGVDHATDRVSDLRTQARALYSYEDRTVRNVIGFVAGVGVVIGVAILFALASGERPQLKNERDPSRGRPGSEPCLIEVQSGPDCNGTEGV